MKYVFVILAKCPIDNGDKKKESISEEDFIYLELKTVYWYSFYTELFILIKTLNHNLYYHRQLLDFILQFMIRYMCEIDQNVIWSCEMLIRKFRLQNLFGSLKFHKRKQP